MRFTKTVLVAKPETLTGIQPGQWIDYEGSKGRYMGRTRYGTIWIAWSRHARGKGFAEFARAYRENAKVAGL